LGDRPTFFLNAVAKWLWLEKPVVRATVSARPTHLANEIEREVKELDEAQRLAIRQARSKPLLREFKTCLLARRMQLVHAGVTAKAIDYMLKRWGLWSCTLMMRACQWTTTRWRK
jgi:hypothetical protein